MQALTTKSFFAHQIDVNAHFIVPQGSTASDAGKSDLQSLEDALISSLADAKQVVVVALYLPCHRLWSLTCTPLRNDISRRNMTAFTRFLVSGHPPPAMFANVERSSAKPYLDADCCHRRRRSWTANRCWSGQTFSRRRICYRQTSRRPSQPLHRRARPPALHELIRTFASKQKRYLHRSKNDICRGIESALIRKDRERDLSAL